MHFQVGVAGHTGYSGAELVKILRHHPSLEPVLLDHREPESTPSTLRRVPLEAGPVAAAHLDAVLLATAPEVSLDAVPWLLKTGTRVVDLSGAFRLRTVENYARWYGATHTSPELLASAVYGLPEFNRTLIAGAQFVSNPGCYPTAANLALRPLLQAGLISLSHGIICDAKSGVSGAGRKPSLKTSFCEVTANFSAYAVLNHRHVPEVLQTSGLEENQFTFTAQLLPIHRGILESIYFRATAGNITRIAEVFAAQYSSEPFVRIYEQGTLPDIHAVAHTNFCDIGFVADQASGRVVVIAAIDNLVKGAAGQAIQNLNLMLGLPEAEGLL
jgi:N-acetyl-gamma-glutamyl-phosphate reductase